MSEMIGVVLMLVIVCSIFAVANGTMITKLMSNIPNEPIPKITAHSVYNDVTLTHSGGAKMDFWTLRLNGTIIECGHGLHIGQTINIKEGINKDISLFNNDRLVFYGNLK